MNNKLDLLKRKYLAFPTAIRATLWFGICNFFQRGVSMLTMPVFSRLLSTEEYGLYSTYISWENILIMIVSLSLYKSLMNLYIKYEDKKYVLSVICFLEFLLTAVWLIVGIIFRNELALLLKIPVPFVVCLFVNFISQTVFQCWSIYKRYVYEYKSLVLVTLFMTFGSAIVSIITVYLYETSAFGRTLGATIVTTVVGVYLYVAVLGKAKHIFNKEIWLFSLKFCIPLMPHYLSEFVLQSSDKIMINYLCSSSEVALYSVAYAVGSLINLFANSINSTFAPYQYQKIKEGNYSALSKRTSQVLFILGFLLAGIMLFSKEIVFIFGGTKYLESVDVIIPICLGVYFNYAFSIFARIQEYYEKKIIIVIPSILCAMLNIILNYTLIPVFGYQAAAYTTFASYGIFCIVNYFMYIKTCNEMLDGKKLYNSKALLMVSLGVIVSGAVIMIINRIIIVKYLLISVVFILLIVRRKRVIQFVGTVISKS